MKWLFGVLGRVLVALLISALLVVGLGLLLIQTGPGAKWVAEKWLQALVDPRLAVNGQTNIDVWPQLSVRTTDLTINSDFAAIPPACLIGNPKDDPTVLHVDSLAWIVDWQRLWQLNVVMPVLSATGVRITLGLSGAATDTVPLSSWSNGWQNFLSRDDTSAWQTGLTWQADEISLQQLQIQHCSADNGLQTQYQLQQARVLSRAGHDDVQLDVVLDGLSVNAAFLKPTIFNGLQQNGFLRDDRLWVETVRSQWRIQGTRAVLESLLWIGPGPTIESVSGGLDLAQHSIDLVLMLQNSGAGSVLKVPGVEIILRRSTLPLHIYGPWSEPTFQFGSD